MKSFFERHFLIYSKTQLTAAIATLVDFLVLIILVERLGMYYVSAVALGAGCGGFVNYVLNRRWTFQSSSAWTSEASRYFFVSAGGLGWNTLLVWLLTEYTTGMYFISKVMTVLLVGLLWNYPLQRYWVFRAEQKIA